jgi:hypothetical protein
MLTAALCLFGASAMAAGPSLDTGYRLMYGLDFRTASQEFALWEQEYPTDPLGPVSAAAGTLFAEFERTGILRSQFFANDASLVSWKAPTVDAAVRSRFDAELARAEKLALARLATAPDDKDALFAMAMVHGLRADYMALIECRRVASLPYTREGATYANKLLALDPSYADAYLATGVGDYVIGSLVAPVRWALRLAGYSGNKARGIQQVKIAAERGRFLAPFARILLAIACLRDHDTTGARALLVGLRRDFPSNPLFAQELERLDHQ